jgi:hypothetical protein
LIDAASDTWRCSCGPASWESNSTRPRRNK